VASAEKTYIDPSALRRLYVHDALSRAFSAWMGRLRGAAPLTAHGRAELVNSIQLAVFRGDIRSKVADEALADLASDLAEGRLAIADVPWRRALERAVQLSRTHTPTLGTRTLDVLHVASAVELGSKAFVTYDERQAALARTAHLRVIRP
jgi:predicted nucleic acid-binding protein